MREKKKRILLIIAMTFFLLSSIALSVTGAYFTAKGDSSNSNLNPTWGDVSVSVSASSLEFKRAGTEETATANMIIMPGDQYRGGKFTAIIKSNDKTGVYAVVKDNTANKYYAVSNSGVDFNTEVTNDSTLTVITNVSGEDGKTITWGNASTDWQYFGNGTNQTEGQGTTATMAGAGNYTIYVIQASNLNGNTAAVELLKLV